MTLDGEWYNELNSKMNVQVRDGLIVGKYTTGVSADACAQGDFAITGRVEIKEDGSACVAFVVVWQNDHSQCGSATSWCGEYRLFQDQEQIKTTWLLTMDTGQKDDWKSTLVGQDLFGRNPPKPEQLASNRRLRRASHPT